MPPFRHLRHDASGLGEIRFSADNVQHRPIGFFDGDQKFVIVLFATETGNKFVPPTAVKLAQARKKQVLDDKNRSAEMEYDYIRNT